LKGDNAAARVAAARTLRAEDERKAPAQGMPQMPGLQLPGGRCAISRRSCSVERARRANDRGARD
jgi:hypothetical protein